MAAPALTTGGAALSTPAPTPLGTLQHRLGLRALRLAWWWAGMAAALLLGLWYPPAVQRLDLLAYDLLLPTHTPVAPAPVVIAIDDASLAALGRWPWPRALHAQMLDQLRAAGAGPVGLAVLFSEPDAADPASDTALADAIARYQQVVLAVAPNLRADGQLQAQALLPALPLQTPPHLGHVDATIDPDGQARSIPLRVGNGTAQLPAMALAMQQLSTPAANPSAREALLPRMPAPPTLSFADALHNPQRLAAVRNRAVFIGATASGLGAALVTPLAGQSDTMPSVALHALAYSALQDQALVRRAAPAWNMLLGLLLVASLALVPLRNGRGVLLASLLLGLPVLASGLLLATAQLWLAPAVATLALAGAMLLWIAGQLRLKNRQLQQARQHAQCTLQAVGDAVITLDASTRTIRFANPTAERQAGHAALRGQTLQTAYPLAPTSLAQLDAALGTCLEQQNRVLLPALLSLHTPHGLRDLQATASPLRSPEGRLDGVVLVLSDVTETLALAHEREHATRHDALTGLPNRLLLQERLAQTLVHRQQHGGHAALLFVGLDRFKHINDSLGQRVGDEVLKVAAERLLALCRSTDTVARWGGDEFVLLLDDQDPAAAASTAAKVVDALAEDITWGARFGNLRLPNAGSVGVATAPQDGTDPDSLLSRASMAMVRAKAQPRACFQFWSEHINADIHQRLALEMDLRQGLRNGQLMLHYQPQFALQNHRLVGMEALMRWQRGPGPLVLPGDFIPVAEDCGLVIDMGAWAILQAARQIAAWLRLGLTPVPIAVNLSARQCQNRDIVQVLQLALRETGIPPQLLRLEITETTAMRDADQVIGLLQDIHALGVKLALDDFGTGYSSLVHLKHFPIDELKIDKSFISGVANDKDDAAIVHATIALAHGLDLKVVAEGLETEAQRRFLVAHQCDTAQGYLMGRPQPLERATMLL